MENDQAGLLIVNYHYIRDPGAYPYPGIHPMEEGAFIRQVQWLGDRFRLVSPEDVEDFAQGVRPLKESSVFLTFDDGLVDHARAVEEVLNPMGVRAAFCVSSKPLVEGRALMVHKIHWLRAHTEPERFRREFLHLLPPEGEALAEEEDAARDAAKIYVYDLPEHARLKYLINFKLPHEVVDEAASAMLQDRGVRESDFCEALYMGEDRIRKLARAGHVIGNHGHSHQPFSVLDPSRLAEEITRNKNRLEQVTGRPQQWVSYPNGREWARPKDVKAFCESFGFSVGLGLDGGWNAGGVSPFCLNRVNANDVEKVV